MMLKNFFVCLLVTLLSCTVVYAVDYPCLKCDSCIAASPDVEGKCEECALGKLATWPCDDASLCKCDPKAADEKDCKSAVSSDGVTLNSECKKLCEANDKSFDAKCQIERYAFLEKVELIDDKCFTNNIYGYTENGVYMSGEDNWNDIGTVIEDIATAQECQELCQKNKTCAYWSWRMKSDNSGKYGADTCLLKTEEEVKQTFDVPMHPRQDEDTSEWTGHVPKNDPLYPKYQWCNLGLRYECDKALYDCLKCPDLICAYKSVYHVAGPKFCNQGSTDCKPVPEPDTCPCCDKCDKCKNNHSAVSAASSSSGLESPPSSLEKHLRTPSAPVHRVAIDVMLLEDNSLNTAELREEQHPVSLKKALAKRFKGKVRVGLASFVDKPLPPFGSFLSRDYCYELHSPLVTRVNDMEEQLAGMHTRNGNDLKENQLGALVDVAKDTMVGWAANVRFVVLVTDEEFHVAGDAPEIAKLSGHTTGCLASDYPSIEDVKDTLGNAHVVPIFAVTQDVASAYEDLVAQLGFGKVIVLGEGAFEDAVANAAYGA